MLILEPLKNQSKFWKSPGNLFLKNVTNPVCKELGFKSIKTLREIALHLELQQQWKNKIMPCTDIILSLQVGVEFLFSSEQIIEESSNIDYMIPFGQHASCNL